ncbi:MAG: App1 family protein [Planctomycetota bacterium]
MRLFQSLLSSLLVSLGFSPGAQPERGCGSDQPPSNIKSDENVVFYPTRGRWDATENVWRISIHGKVFEPEEDSIKRKLFVSWLKTSVNKQTEGLEIRDDRINPFLVDNERGKSITITLAGKLRNVGKSESNGHFTVELTLEKDDLPIQTDRSSVIKFDALLPAEDSRSFQGRVHLISPKGVSVISDIDDTIKVSKVTDKSELLKNTFMRPFRAVGGMAETYRQLADAGAVFHYVSGSPWQLYQPLQGFLLDESFPQGTLQLKHFRLKDSSAFDLIGSQIENKLAAIKPLLRDFPDRQFILVGDTGEQDPEIYGQLAREFPQQIRLICLRNVTNANQTDARMNEAFEGVEDDRWLLFDQAAEWQNRIAEIGLLLRVD